MKAVTVNKNFFVIKIANAKSMLMLEAVGKAIAKHQEYSDVKLSDSEVAELKQYYRMAAANIKKAA